MEIVNTEVLATLIRARIPMVVLDARSGKWDDGRRIPTARPMPVDAPEERIARLLPYKEILVVTYCGGMACPLSQQLGERLEQLGYHNVLRYQQGLAGWLAAGQPTEKDRAAA